MTQNTLIRNPFSHLTRYFPRTVVGEGRDLPRDSVDHRAWTPAFAGVTPEPLPA